MKRRTLLTGIAAAMFILLSCSFSMAAALPFNIGLLAGDTDILVGQITEGDGFPTIDILYSSDAFDILLEESGEEASFVWNPTSDEIDFLMVRTVLPVNEFSGNSLSITLSTDEYALSYENDPAPEVFFKGNSIEWPSLTTDNSIPSAIIWNFNDYAGEDPERRLLVSDLIAGNIDDGGDEMGLGVTRLSDEGNRYKIIALSGTIPTDNIFTHHDGSPFSEVLGVWETETLEGEYHFTRNRNSDEYLYIVIQNWSTSELDLDESPEAQFISDNFDRWLGPEGGEPQLALIGNPEYPSVFGAGVSVIVTPFNNVGDPTNSNQYRINELDGTFSVYVTETKPNVPEQFQPQEVALEFTWDEASSSGGCATVEFIPGSLLLLLPLFSLFK